MERVMGIEPTTTAWKAVVLPLNYTRAYTFNGATSGNRTHDVGATIRCVDHFAIAAIIFGRGSRNRTHTGGFGDLCSTFKLYPCTNGGGGRIRTAEPGGSGFTVRRV